MIHETSWQDVALFFVASLPLLLIIFWKGGG